MIAYIGTNAGLIWNALDKLGKMDVKQLKKATKIRTEKAGSPRRISSPSSTKTARYSSHCANICLGS